MDKDWFYDAVGRAYPLFIREIAHARTVLEDTVNEGYWPIAKSQLVLFAIAVLHREKPITTLSQLQAAIAKIEKPKFNFSAAEALLAQREATTRTELATTFAAFEQRRAQTGAAQMERELLARGYPDGRQANIALMRQILAEHDTGQSCSQAGAVPPFAPVNTPDLNAVDVRKDS
jgi:hypothetical protein